MNVMKKGVLSFLFLTALFLNKSFAQPCSLANLQITVSTGADGKCYADISYDMDRNNGNKFVYVHLWNSANYALVNGPRWQKGSGPDKADIDGSGNSHPSLVTVAIDNFNYPAPVFSSFGYRPDPTVTTRNGTSITSSAAPVSGSGPHAYYRYTITHVLLGNTVNGGCTSANVQGIVWSTQANSQNSHIHCSVIGKAPARTLDITGSADCATQKYTLDVDNNTNGTVTGAYSIFADNGGNGNNGIFDPNTDTQIGTGNINVSPNNSQTFMGTIPAAYLGYDLWAQVTLSNNTTQVIKLSTTTCPRKPAINPDVNVTYINVQVPGNVSTNDKVPAGTTYGTPVLGSKPAGSVATLTMNPNGNYTFIANIPGVYTYNVPVCVPGQVLPCPTALLTITVLDPNLQNPPVANTDFATTKANTAVTINSLANDAAGNTGGSLNPASVTVITAPLHGTTTVNPATGAVTYTPNAGFVGMDELTYRVCDNGTPVLCATAKQFITVELNTSANTTIADDDYDTTPINTPATGNVKDNDSDPEGNTQTVTAQTTTIPTKGTLVLNSNGTYTFTPVAGFTGPVSFSYNTCDNGVPQACAGATLYILVIAPPGPVYNPDINVTYVNVPVPGNVNTNDKVPAGTTYGTPVPAGGNPAGGTLTLNPNGTYNFVSTTPGVFNYNVPVCIPGQPLPCPTTLLTITVLSPNLNNPPVANTDIGVTKVNTPVVINSLANDKPGNPGGSLNPASVIVVTAPLHGTAAVNAVTGAITYTPTPGYVGSDELTYQVCDNGIPVLCATAKQFITVNPGNAVNTTSAADDYITSPMNTVANGNVKTNDTDPEGNTQTVTAQTTTAAGKGTLVLTTAGTYTFTPVAGFTGPVSFAYTTCDNGTPQACANATLYILVTQSVPPPDLTPRINLNPNNVLGTSKVEITVQVNEIANAPTNGSMITLFVDKLSGFSNFSFNSAQITNQAGQPVQNNMFTVDAASNPNFYIIRTSAVFLNGGLRVAFTVTETPGQTKGSTPVNVYLENGSGGETNFTNNTSFTTLTFSF